MDDKLEILLNHLIESLKYKGDQSLFEGYYNIEFTPPFYQTGELHPETQSKFVKIFGIPLEKGIYGPVYRYIPSKNNLKADNDLGGYFTDENINCIGCAKKKLWLFDKNLSYYYNYDKYILYRHECFLIINDDSFATIFIGKVANGDAYQIRPNNWIFNEQLSHNKIIYKCLNEITLLSCDDCKSFIENIEK